MFPSVTTSPVLLLIAMRMWAAASSPYETCFSREHQSVCVNMSHALNSSTTFMNPRVTQSEKDCVLACCSEDIRPGIKCTLAVFYSHKSPEPLNNQNCHLFYCQNEQDCPLQPAELGTNTYDIFKGLIHPTMRPPPSTVQPTSTTTTQAPTPTSTFPTTTTTTTTTPCTTTTTQQLSTVRYTSTQLTTTTKQPTTTTPTQPATSTTTQPTTTQSMKTTTQPITTTIQPTTTTTQPTTTTKQSTTTQPTTTTTQPTTTTTQPTTTTTQPTTATTQPTTTTNQPTTILTVSTATTKQHTTMAAVSLRTTTVKLITTKATSLRTTQPAAAWTVRKTSTNPSALTTITTMTRKPNRPPKKPNKASKKVKPHPPNTKTTTSPHVPTSTAPPPPTPAPHRDPEATRRTEEPPTVSTSAAPLTFRTTPATALVPKRIQSGLISPGTEGHGGRKEAGHGALKSSLVAVGVVGLAILTLALAVMGRKAMESFDRRHYTRLELNDLHYEV